jgi:hypothetical protein
MAASHAFFPNFGHPATAQLLAIPEPAAALSFSQE